MKAFIICKSQQQESWKWMVFIQQQQWASCPHHRRGFPGCDVSECNWKVSGLKRPWLQPPRHNWSENVTLITTLIPFTMLSSPYWEMGEHMHTHWHTQKQMKSRIVSKLLSSALSQGLPVVKSLGVLVLSCCQKFCLREKLCVWPDNFGLQTLNFVTECVDVCAHLCVNETLFFVREHHVARCPLAAPFVS